MREKLNDHSIVQLYLNVFCENLSSFFVVFCENLSKHNFFFFYNQFYVNESKHKSLYIQSPFHQNKFYKVHEMNFNYILWC